MPVLSIPLEVDPTCRYERPVHHEGFGDTMSNAGGINTPKILKVKCSDGEERRWVLTAAWPCPDALSWG